MNISAIGQDREWIGTKTAAERLGCPVRAVIRLAKAGYLTMRAIPTCDPVYLASDVERLAGESTRYALNREATSAAVGGFELRAATGRGPGYANS